MSPENKRKLIASRTADAILERVGINDELVKAFRRLLDHRSRRANYRKAHAFVLDHVLTLIEAEMSSGRRTPTFRKRWIDAINKYANWDDVRRRVSVHCIDEVAVAFAKHASSRPNFDEMPDDPRSFGAWINYQVDNGYVPMGVRTYSLVDHRVKSCVFIIDAVHCFSPRT